MPFERDGVVGAQAPREWRDAFRASAASNAGPRCARLGVDVGKHSRNNRSGGTNMISAAFHTTSDRRVPRRSSAIFPKLTCASSTHVISF
jgi:hypothetical protein